MKKVKWLTVLVCLLIATSLAGISLAGDDVVAPFLDAKTDVVVHIDLSKLDMDAVNTWVQASLDKSKLEKADIEQSKKQTTDQVNSAKEWLEKFKKAGGKDAYGVISFGDLFMGGGVVVIPLAEGADSDALTKLMSSDGSGPTGAVMGKNLVLGTPQAIDKAKAAKSQPRPDLTEALQMNPEAQIHVAVSSTILNGINMISPQAQEGFLKNFMATKWGTISVTIPPKGSLKATIQCNDAAAATALAAALNAQIDKMKEDPHAKEALAENLDKWIAALKPAMDGAKLSISLDQELVGTIVPQLGKGSFMPFGVTATQGDGDTTRPGAMPPDDGPGGL